MRLIEILDPVKIPAPPIQKARLSTDLMRMSGWLIKSLASELDKKNPEWRMGSPIKPLLKTIQTWAQEYPQEFPKFQTDVYNLLAGWDLEFGVVKIPDPNQIAGYDERRKIVVFNSTRLHKQFDPKELSVTAVGSLMHELRHAYDDRISKGKGLGDDRFTDYQTYLALPAEVRARFTEMEPELMQELYFANGHIKDSSYFRVIMPELMNKYELTPAQLSKHKNPQKVYQKLMGKAWLLKQSMDKLTDAQRAQVIKGLHNTQGMPPQVKSLWQKIKRIIEVF